MRTIARPEVEKIVSFVAPEEARALSVQFVLRTPPIPHLSKNNNSVIVNAEASTLWQRITNLFRKLVNIFRG
ncbi:MAG: hypothetical protein DDT36_00952 [Firmicutes bacterium]|nr:hypothetical protein [Bacillota bacterium]